MKLGSKVLFAFLVAVALVIVVVGVVAAATGRSDDAEGLQKIDQEVYSDKTWPGKAFESSFKFELFGELFFRSLMHGLNQV